jgi:hypothetical protein
MLRDNGFVDIFTPVLSLDDVSPSPPPEPRGPHSTKFIIPWPLHLSASSASLQTSLPFPLSGYRNGLCHSRVILTDPQTFRAFSAHLSRIAAFSPPGASLCALPSSFHKNYSHHLGPHGGLATPTKGISASTPFALATALLVACLPTRRLLLPSFQPLGHPQ